MTADTNIKVVTREPAAIERNFMLFPRFGVFLINPARVRQDGRQPAQGRGGGAGNDTSNSQNRNIFLRGFFDGGPSMHLPPPYPDVIMVGVTGLSTVCQDRKSTRLNSSHL